MTTPQPPSKQRSVNNGLGGIIIVAVLFFILPVLGNFDGETIYFEAILSPPSFTHLLGTDHLGRDVFHRTVLGGGSILMLSLLSTLIGVGIGVVIGTVAGYYGGWMDEALMRVGDAVMALPALILAMLITVAIGSGPTALVVAVSIISIPRVARITRSVVLNVVVNDFVAAAAVSGESRASVMLREILPNMVPNISVELCLRFSYAIMTIAALGYLGIGLQPPIPDWGLMVSEGAPYIIVAPWIILGPSCAIILSVVSVNLLGDEMLERNEHRLRRRSTIV